VVVHGTRFVVRVRDAAENRTCVRVQEGIVAVHQHVDGHERSVRLHAGDQLGCEAEPKQPTSAQDHKPARVVHRKRTSNQEALEPVAPSGTLAEENRLLSDALAAERDDDRARARRLFQKLLDRYPSSPLARDAASGIERTR
jgi:TolA-binding protein